MTPAKYILTFLWGAFTMACWFLSWNKLGYEDMPIPNGMLLAALISSIVAVVMAVMYAVEE